MPGNEIIGKEEFNELKKIFTVSNGVLFAHAFDKRSIRSYQKLEAVGYFKFRRFFGSYWAHCRNYGISQRKST